MMVMQKKKHSLRERTAYHEAGHAVSHFVLRVPFRYVTIKPDIEKHTLSHVYGVFPKKFNPELNRDIRTRTRVEHEIMTSLAGHIAEKIASGRTDNVGASFDNHAAVDLASYVTSSDGEMNAYLEWLRIRTESLLLLPLHWDMIEEVANALMKRETISAKDAKKIMQATAGVSID
jgi:ATP-dependent Zn protease